MASIEIKSNETFSYYPGSLKDIDQNRALVSYEENWKPDEWVPLENVRAAATPFDPSTFQPLPSQTVEAMAKSSENEPYSWWQAVVKNVRGEFYFISYSAFDDTFNEILEKDMLRPFNTNPSLKFSDYTKLEIPLPRELWDSVSNTQFQELRDTTGCLSLYIDYQKHQLVVLGQQQTVKRVKLLATMRLKHLVEIQKLQAKTLTKRSEIDQLMQRQKEGITEEFKCDPAIMGLVIGKKGKNIKTVEAMEGVMKVRVDSVKGVVNILAKDAECARKARAMLEFVDQRFPIPAASVGRIVGQKFANIRDIEQNSGVVRIKVGDNDDQVDRSHSRHKPDEMIDLVIIGTRESVADAVILLEQHINFLKTYSQLSEEDRTLSDKISQLALDVGPPGRNQGVGRGGYGGQQQRRAAPEGEDADDYDRSQSRRGGARGGASGRGGRGGSEAGGRGGSEAGRGGGESGRGRGRGGAGRGRGGGRGGARAADAADVDDDAAPASAPVAASEDSGRGGRGRGRGGRGRGNGRGGNGNAQAPREEKAPSSDADVVSDRPVGDRRARRTDEDRDVNEVGEAKPRKPREPREQREPKPKKQPEYKAVDKSTDKDKKEAAAAATSDNDKDDKKTDGAKEKRPRRQRQEATTPATGTGTGAGTDATTTTATTIAPAKSPSPAPAGTTDSKPADTKAADAKSPAPAPASAVAAAAKSPSPAPEAAGEK